HGQVRAATLHCERCHGEAQWKPQKPRLEFDHDDKAQAAMPLVGTHADVACAKCHPRSQFKLARFEGDCALCHKSPHDGQLFGTKKCQVCHSPALRSLREVTFDHKKETGLAVVGKHANIECASCHTRSLAKRKPPATCEGCHARDSKHGSRFDKL